MAHKKRSDIILDACKEIALQNNLRVTNHRNVHYESAELLTPADIKGAMTIGMVGLGSVFGGVLGGRLGFLLGAALGGLVGSSASEESVAEIIQNVMTPEQQRKLVNKISELIEGINFRNVASLMNWLTKNRSLKDIIISTIVEFFAVELCRNITKS